MKFTNNCTKSNKQPNILSLLFQILLQFHIKSLPIYFMLAMSTIILISVYRYMGMSVIINMHLWYISRYCTCAAPLPYPHPSKYIDLTHTDVRDGCSLVWLTILIPIKSQARSSLHPIHLA